MSHEVTRTPMPSYRVMHRIIQAYAELPLTLDLNERSPFRTLLRIVDDPLLRDRLLRSLYVEYCREGTIDLQTRFEIAAPNAHPERPGAGFMVKEEALNAEGEDFLRSVSPRLHALYGYLRDLIRERDYEDANWTIELVGGTEDLVRRVRALELRYKLRKAGAEYLNMRRNLEKGEPVVATFSNANLSGFVFSITHKP